MILKIIFLCKKKQPQTSWSLAAERKVEMTLKVHKNLKKTAKNVLNIKPAKESV